jgi:hypothetical protein
MMETRIVNIEGQELALKVIDFAAFKARVEQRRAELARRDADREERDRIRCLAEAFRL